MSKCSDPKCPLCNPLSWYGKGGYVTGPSSGTQPAPVPSSQDFSGVDFDLAIGELYGLRVWKMDEYGRLRARHLDVAAAWRPGVNTAVCHRRDREAATMAGYAGLSPAFLRAAAGLMSRDLAQDRSADPAHPCPDEHCQCGFYAYTQPGPETHATDAEGLILGAIRGTGRTLVGTKGFRCEKAEIVAFLDPREEYDPHAWADWQAERLTAVYPGVPVLASRAELLQFAPLQPALPEPTTDAFWTLP